jgi:hypothetical protein
MRKFKPRKDNNKLGAVLLIIIVTLSVGYTAYSLGTNSIVAVLLYTIGIIVLTEITRTLWYHYED